MAIPSAPAVMPAVPSALPSVTPSAQLLPVAPPLRERGGILRFIIPNALPVRAQRKPLPRYIVDRLLNLITGYPTDTWEFASSCLAMAWGLWIILFPSLLNLHQFSAFRETLAFLEGSGIGANLFIGGLMFLCGLHGFIALFVSRFDPFRVYSSAILAFAWISVAWGFGASEVLVIKPPEAAQIAVQITVETLSAGGTPAQAAELAAEAIRVNGFVTEGWRLTSTPVYGLFFLLSALTFVRLLSLRKHVLKEGVPLPSIPAPAAPS